MLFQRLKGKIFGFIVQILALQADLGADRAGTLHGGKRFRVVNLSGAGIA